MELVQGNLRLPLRASEADDRKPRAHRGFFYGGPQILTKNTPRDTRGHSSANPMLTAGNACNRLNV